MPLQEAVRIFVVLIILVVSMVLRISISTVATGKRAGVKELLNFPISCLTAHEFSNICFHMIRKFIGDPAFEIAFVG